MEKWWQVKNIGNNFSFAVISPFFLPEYRSLPLNSLFPFSHFLKFFLKSGKIGGNFLKFSGS